MVIEAVTAERVAALVGGTVEGNPETRITAIAPIENAAEGHLSFIVKPAFDEWLEKSPAAVLLVRQDSPPAPQRCLIRVDNPYLAFVRCARELFAIGEPRHSGIHPTAIVSDEATVEDNVSIGAGSVIHAGVRIESGTIIGSLTVVHENAQIGPRCQIGDRVTIHDHSRLGEQVIIQSGTVIGSDGFGYVKDGVRYYKIPHIGRVVLEDFVEIGANCAIDRGTFGETRICRGTKLDNLIHVAHNVRIGENTVIAAQTGISGSTRIGKEVTIAGQVGFVGHIEVGDRSVFGAQAGVTKSIPAGITVSGYPAKPHFQARREEAALRRAPELLKRVKKLEQEIEKLRSQ